MYSFMYVKNIKLKKFRKRSEEQDSKGENTKLPHKFLEIKEEGTGVPKIMWNWRLIWFYLDIKKLDIQKDDWR